MERNNWELMHGRRRRFCAARRGIVIVTAEKLETFLLSK